MGVRGGIPEPRPDQWFQGRSRSGTGPAPQQNIIQARIVIVSGPSGGEFVYNATRTQLLSSNAGAPTTDPVLGIAVPQGFATYNAHGAVINLLSTANSAFFQYFDTGTTTQGALILAVSSSGGTDPLDGTTYPAGLFGVDPVFGDSFSGVGATILLGQVAYTRSADVTALTAATSSNNPLMLIDAPEQTTSSHIQIQLQGASPDATRLAQMLVGPVSAGGMLTAVSTATVEFQGGASGQAVLRLIVNAVGNTAISATIPGDTVARYQVIGSGKTFWGSGSGAVDVAIERLSANLLGVDTADLAVHTAGRGLRVAEGANAKQGTATLTAGTSGAIANTSVTANSRIFITAQDNNSAGAMRVSARVAGTSFTITSSNAADTGVVAWEMFEPG